MKGEVKYITFHQKITLAIERPHDHRYDTYNKVEDMFVSDSSYNLDKLSPPTLGI